MLKLLEHISQLVPLFILFVTILGFVVGKIFYKISFLQPLEKIANEQKEYQRKNRQEDLKIAITERHLLLGNNLLNVGNLNAAKLEFKAALNIDSVNELAAMGLFKSQIRDNIDNYGFTTELLIKKIDLIFQFNKNDEHALYFMGLLYRDLDYKLAIKYFQKATESNPEFPDAFYRLGMIYETLDEYDTKLALPYYEKALSLSKYNQTYLNNLAYQYFQFGEYEKAIKNYETLIKIDKDDLLPYLTVSTSYLLANDFSKCTFYINLFLDKIEKQPDIMGTVFNQLKWHFESFNEQKVLLDSTEKKLIYGYLSGFIKMQ
ncbi:tetratricopeptide repeat protein [Mucilaginibacter sp. HD30]